MNLSVTIKGSRLSAAEAYEKVSLRYYKREPKFTAAALITSECINRVPSGCARISERVNALYLPMCRFGEVSGLAA